MVGSCILSMTVELKKMLLCISSSNLSAIIDNFVESAKIEHEGQSEINLI